MCEIKTVAIVNENLQSEENGSEGREVPRLRYEIPENYLMEEVDNINLQLSKRLQGYTSARRRWTTSIRRLWT